MVSVSVWSLYSPFIVLCLRFSSGGRSNWVRFAVIGVAFVVVVGRFIALLGLVVGFGGGGVIGGLGGG